MNFIKKCQQTKITHSSSNNKNNNDMAKNVGYKGMGTGILNNNNNSNKNNKSTANLPIHTTSNNNIGLNKNNIKYICY